MSPLTNGQNHRLMVGMDIGSANITCAVGQANSSTNRIKLRVISSMPSKGIKRGIITNRNELIDTLEKIINDVERMASIKITNAVLSITGEHIRSLNTQAAIQLNRDKVYISNVVNYRPPANRKPTEDEIKRYLPYLKSHIEIINPKILVLLGSTALNTLIGSESVISKARGKWIQKEIGKIKPWIIASFHPAFLMRQPEQKKLAWIDLKMIRDKLKILKI